MNGFRFGLTIKERQVNTVDEKLEVIGEYVGPTMIRLEAMRIDEGSSPDDYQRPLRRHFDRWDWSLYDPIRLANRDGVYHVYVGGHRVREALRFGLKELPAFVLESQGVAAEAGLFTRDSRCRVGLTAIDKYKAACVAGESWAIAIKRTLHEFGFVIGESEGWPNVGTVTSLRRGAPGALRFACEIIKEVWPGHTQALGNMIFSGLMLFWSDWEGKTTGRKFNRARFIERLRGYSPIRILQETSVKSISGDARSKCAAAFHAIYSKRPLVG